MKANRQTHAVIVDNQRFDEKIESLLTYIKEQPGVYISAKPDARSKKSYQDGGSRICILKDERAIAENRHRRNADKLTKKWSQSTEDDVIVPDLPKCQWWHWRW